LPVEVVDQQLLRCQSNGEIFVEWTRMPVTSPRHLIDKVTVTVI